MYESIYTRRKVLYPQSRFQVSVSNATSCRMAIKLLWGTGVVDVDGACYAVNKSLITLLLSTE